jgi:hypothetical protein
MPKKQGLAEAEWPSCADPRPMLVALQGKASERKLRLFAVACCRQLGPLLSDPRITTALDVAERHADGASTQADLEAALRGASRAQHAQRRKALLFAYAAVMDACGPGPVGPGAAEKSAWAAAAAADPRTTYGERLRQVRPDLYASLAELLRDVIGNPFRPVPVDRSWSTPAVARLAQDIYDDRAFDRLPDLADALKEAGCANAEVLGHCRQPGTHARGCWVIDGLLQRA